MRGEKIFEKTIWRQIRILRHSRQILINEFQPKTISYYRQPCSIKMEFYVTELGESFDLDNLIKQLLDLLVDAGLLFNDMKVFNIEATKHEAYLPELERFTVEIYQWGER